MDYLLLSYPVVEPSWNQLLASTCKSLLLDIFHNHFLVPISCIFVLVCHHWVLCCGLHCYGLYLMRGYKHSSF